MIIAVDGYEANTANRVGIGRYAYEILKHMFQEGKRKKSLRLRSGQAKVESKQDFSFRIYIPEKPLPDMPKETDWWQYRIAGPKKLWTFVGLPMALAVDQPRVDVVFSPTHYIPRFVDIPKVMSIMDLSYLHYPELFRAKDLHQLVHWTKYSVNHAQKILTISKFSRDAIIKEYGVRSDKVIVTYPGITMEPKVKSPTFVKTMADKQKSKVLEKYHLNKDYILSVGTLQPRKNFVRLIEAFSKIKVSNSSLELVIVGKKGWLYEEILEAPEKFGVADSVKLLDFVEDSDLFSLYENAICFVLPSLYEGFGLPVLEAMAAGSAVVVSNVSSIPEVAGKAGIYIDPLDVESISFGIQQAITEYKTKSWKDRILLGKEIAKQFTWEKAAKQTLAILEDVGKLT